MNHQEAFDRSLQHLWDQNQQAINLSGQCCYRMEDGRMCGIGCLIPDNFYLPKMENQSVSLIFGYPGIVELFNYDRSDFLDNLQGIHDQYHHRHGTFRQYLLISYTNLARKFGLNTVLVDKLHGELE